MVRGSPSTEPPEPGLQRSLRGSLEGGLSVGSLGMRIKQFQIPLWNLKREQHISLCLPPHGIPNAQYPNGPSPWLGLWYLRRQSLHTLSSRPLNCWGQAAVTFTTSKCRYRELSRSAPGGGLFFCDIDGTFCSAPRATQRRRDEESRRQRQDPHHTTR